MSEAATGFAGRLAAVVSDTAVRAFLSRAGAGEDWRLSFHGDAASAVREGAADETDILLTDLPDGLVTLRDWRRRAGASPVIVLATTPSIEQAVECMRGGAFDYIPFPPGLGQLRAVVRRAYLHRQLAESEVSSAAEVLDRAQFGNLVGASRPMLSVYGLIRKAARSRANVLILGESGTGKELVARALHSLSPRASRRFVAVSCAALPSELLESELFGHEKGAFTGANWQRQGRFELADGGTLFLDEIGDISLAVQAKLLRALQEREIDRVGGVKPIKVDVRIIAATNRDLPASIAAKQFREDLYYRLRVLEISLPPLRERGEDVRILANHFLHQFARRDGRSLAGLSGEAMAVLEGYPWPGNVRELENAIEHAAALAEEDGELLGPELLPEHVLRGSERVPYPRPQPAAPVDAPPDVPRAEDVVEALSVAGWDLAQAAARLGVPFSAVAYAVRRHNLVADLGSKG